MRNGQQQYDAHVDCFFFFRAYAEKDEPIFQSVAPTAIHARVLRDQHGSPTGFVCLGGGGGAGGVFFTRWANC